MVRGVNTAKETVAVADTDPIYSDAVDLRTIGKVLCKITNNTDQTVTITPQFTTFDDEDFEASVAGNDVEIATTATGHFVSSDPWAYARVKCVAGGAPAQGGTITVVWEFKHGRD